MIEYAQLGAKDYIPGAEILRDSAEIEADEKQQGVLFSPVCSIPLSFSKLAVYISTIPC